jgi:thiamine-phosphate pyrophosphorylase
MRLEDSLLYLILDPVVGRDMEEFCVAAIEGGVDVIHLPLSMSGNKEIVKSVRDVCQREDALFLVSDDIAVGVESDGIHLSTVTGAIGRARAMIGVDGLLGISTQSVNDAILALEVGADFLLHWAGTGCPAEFSGLPRAAGSVLFAAGLSSLDDARSVVDGGVYRLCIESKLLDGDDVMERTAEFSRVLGRSI